MGYYGSTCDSVISSSQEDTKACWWQTAVWGIAFIIEHDTARAQHWSFAELTMTKN